MNYTAIYIDNPNLSEKVDEFPIDVRRGARVIVLPTSTAREFLDRAEKINGWQCSAGTGYTRTALTVREVEEPAAPKWMGSISESNRKLLEAAQA